MPEAAACLVRPAEPADLAFISETWAEGFRRGSAWAHRLTNRVYFSHHAPVIAALLSRSAVLVAADPQDPAVIYGYVVFEVESPEGPALHWCYVKKAWRRLGVATRLVEAAVAAGLPAGLVGVNITHPTYPWFAVRNRSGGVDRHGIEEKFPRAVNNPYLGLGMPAREVGQLSVTWEEP